MSVNLNETMTRIRKAGTGNCRAVPMPGADPLTGMYKIEINDGAQWTTLVESLPKSSAFDIITQATNRVICG